MEQQYQPQQMYSSPQNHQGSNIVALTNPAQGLLDLEMTYRGLKMLDDGSTVPQGVPLMNEIGINSVMGQVRSIVDQLTILGNIEELWVMESIWVNFNDTLIKDLMNNWRFYGIERVNRSTIRDVILTEASNKVWAALLRAYKEGDRRFFKGSVLENRTFVETSQGKTGLARLVGWGK